jgi:hypothetical protein
VELITPYLLWPVFSIFPPLVVYAAMGRIAAFVPVLRMILLIFAILYVAIGVTFVAGVAVFSSFWLLAGSTLSESVVPLMGMSIGWGPPLVIGGIFLIVFWWLRPKTSNQPGNR